MKRNRFERSTDRISEQQQRRWLKQRQRLQRHSPSIQYRGRRSGWRPYIQIPHAQLQHNRVMSKWKEIRSFFSFSFFSYRLQKGVGSDGGWEWNWLKGRRKPLDSLATCRRRRWWWWWPLILLVSISNKKGKQWHKIILTKRHTHVAAKRPHGFVTNPKKRKRKEEGGRGGGFDVFRSMNKRHPPPSSLS